MREHIAKTESRPISRSDVHLLDGLRVTRHGWVADMWAVVALALLAWLAFGLAFTHLGHHGDSWSYMSMMRDAGPLAILEAQPGRVALPLAWAIGYSIAGPEPWIYHLIVTVFLLAAATCLYWTILTLVPGARMFAFTTAALSMLWPADPTRYDAATLGNRQSLFFFS